MQADISQHADLDMADHSVVLKQQNSDMLAEHVEESKRVVVIFDRARAIMA